MENNHSLSLSKSIEPLIQNIISTFRVGCKLDLKEMSYKARNSEYNPKRFNGLIMRIREPRTTALIFASGKIVCTGAKTEAASKLAARKYARIIQKLGYDVKFLEFKVQNVVGSADIQQTVDLNMLDNFHKSFCNYEPEIFPNLIYRMMKPEVVLLIYASGKLVLTGAKTIDQVYEAFKNIYPILISFKRRLPVNN